MNGRFIVTLNVINGLEKETKWCLLDCLQKKLATKLSEEGANREQIHQIARQLVHYSVRTFSPHFHNQLYAGIDIYGLAGAWLTEALNTSQ